MADLVWLERDDESEGFYVLSDAGRLFVGIGEPLSLVEAWKLAKQHSDHPLVLFRPGDSIGWDPPDRTPRVSHFSWWYKRGRLP